ncbi:MAG: EMC3/TMCO1 family protein, partial [Candidatus Nanohaloarchaea archaeon]
NHMAYGFAIDFFLGIMRPLFPYTFDPLFGSLLGIGSPLTGARLTVLTISITLSGLISVIYYLLMDVEEYQRIKEKREELNEKMSAAQDEGDTGEAKEYMSEMAGMQKEFFTVMLRPMIASMLIFFLLLPWMFTTFNPIVPLQDAGNGTYTGTLDFNGRQIPLRVEQNTSAVSVDGEQYAAGERFAMDDLHWKVKAVDTGRKQVKFAAEIVPLPVSLPLVGDELSWLGAYILISIPFTFLFRRYLGIQ